MGNMKKSVMGSVLIMWFLGIGFVLATPPFSGSLCDPHCGSNHGTPPSHHGGGGGKSPSPSHGGGGTTPSPSHGGGGHSTPSNPSPGNCGTPPSTDPSPPSGGGGYYPSPSTPPTPTTPYVPTPSTPSTPTTPYVPTPSTPTTPYVPTPSTPYVPTPSTPTTPSPPFVPVDPNSPFPCNYWRNHPGIVWGLVGWWGTVGNAFGVTSLPGFGTTGVSLQQLLSNTRNDGYGALYREGTASLLNSMVTHRFPFTTMQVRDRFISGLSSNKAAAAQAHLFKMANDAKLGPHN